MAPPNPDPMADRTIDRSELDSSNDPLVHQNQTEGIDLPASVGVPALPELLGDYEIIARLGGGGMGIVYKACHRRLQRIVALKVLRPEYSEQPQAVQRFLREMTAAGRLDHENLARIHDAREESGILFFVMEYVDGEDLKGILERRGKLPIDEACRIVLQAASALQHMQQCGLVHRDIKPSNLMLTGEAQVKVVDLGLARLRDRPGEDLTIAGRVLGTIDYIAPEQAQGRLDVDIRADLYSLGCTMYHLLVGRPPYGRPEYPSDSAKLLAHMQASFPSLRAARPEVPEHLEAVVNRLVAKDPDERFATPAELIEAVAPYCSGAPPSTMTLPPRPIQSRRGPGRLRAVLMGMAIVLLLLAAPAWWHFVAPSAPLHAPIDADPLAIAGPVSVVSSTLWVRRAGDDTTIQRLKIDQESSGDRTFPALAPEDDFKLAVEFSQPTQWCLVWLDTRGVVSMVAQSDSPETTAEYPAGDQLVSIDPDDPPGRHLLIMLVSEHPLAVARQEILARLADLGPPPTVPLDQVAQLRGPGVVSPSGVPLDPTFSERLQKRLPRGVYTIHQLSLPTVR